MSAEHKSQKPKIERGGLGSKSYIEVQAAVRRAAEQAVARQAAAEQAAARQASAEQAAARREAAEKAAAKRAAARGKSIEKKMALYNADKQRHDAQKRLYTSNSTDAFIGMAVAGLTGVLAAFGGGEARATAPSSIHPTESAPTGIESNKNIPLKPKGLIVDLSRQPLIQTPLRTAR
jgi:hypothetical protein